MHLYPTRSYSLQDHMEAFEFPIFSYIYYIADKWDWELVFSFPIVNFPFLFPTSPKG